MLKWFRKKSVSEKMNRVMRKVDKEVSLFFKINARLEKQNEKLDQLALDAHAQAEALQAQALFMVSEAKRAQLSRNANQAAQEKLKELIPQQV